MLTLLPLKLFKWLKTVIWEKKLIVALPGVRSQAPVSLWLATTLTSPALFASIPVDSSWTLVWFFSLRKDYLPLHSINKIYILQNSERKETSALTLMPNYHLLAKHGSALQTFLENILASCAPSSYILFFGCRGPLWSKKQESSSSMVGYTYCSLSLLLLTTKSSGHNTKRIHRRTLKSEQKRWTVEKSQNLEKWPKRRLISQVLFSCLILTALPPEQDPVTALQQSNRAVVKKHEQLKLWVKPYLSGQRSLEKGPLKARI